MLSKISICPLLDHCTLSDKTEVLNEVNWTVYDIFDCGDKFSRKMNVRLLSLYTIYPFKRREWSPLCLGTNTMTK